MKTAKQLLHAYIDGSARQSAELFAENGALELPYLADLGIEPRYEGPKRYASLSRREREVMGRVVSGLLNKQVAGELGISEITVKGHRGQMMRKMKADSLAALVRMAVRLDLPLTLCRYSSVRRAIPLSSEPSRRGAASTAGPNGRLRAVADG